MDIATFLRQSGQSQRQLADKLGVTQSAVSQWICGRVPAERVLAIEIATGGNVTRHDLRPDLYPLDLVQASDPPSAQAARQEVA